MKLFYKKIGEGKPLLILHGLFGSLDNWQTQGKQLAEKGFAVYLVDQRNHGHSPHSETWNYKAMSDDVLELMETNKFEKISIIGHSMGGKTALYFANEHPEKVENLIVVDIAPKYYPVHHHAVIEALKAVDLNAISSRKEAEEVLNGNLPGDIATQQFLLKSLYWKENAEKKLAWRFNLDVIASNIENIGEEVKTDHIIARTLFVKGEKSRYINEEDIKDIKNHFQHVQIEVVEDAGHWIHAEKPAEFFNCVVGFLTPII